MEDSLRAMSIKYVVLIGICLPIFYYAVYFKAPTELELIADYEQQLIQLDGEIKRLDREISDGDQTKINLERIKNEIKALSSFFVIEADSRNIEQIISIEARSAGISFTSLQKVAEDSYAQPEETLPGTIPAASNYIKRSLIEANFKGTFTELMRFLAFLSRTKRIISLKSIELRSNQSEFGYSPAGLKLSFKADFETYEIIKDVNAEVLAPSPVVSDEGELER